MTKSKINIPGFSDQALNIAAASIAINILALAFPLLMLQIYDRIIPHQSLSTLSIFVFAVLLAGLMESALRYCRSYLSLWSSARFEHGAMKALVQRLLGEPLHDYELKGTGALTQLFKSISLLKSHQSGQTFQQLLDLPFSVFYVAIVFVLSKELGSALLSAILIFAVVVFISNQAFSKWVSASQEADLRRGNFLNETLRYIHTVKSMSMEALMLRRHDRLQAQCAKSVTDLTVIIERNNAIGTVFLSMSAVVLTSIGAWLVVERQLTSGELAACLMLGIRALNPVQRMGTLWIRFQQDRHHKRGLLQALDGLKIEDRDATVSLGESDEGPLGIDVEDLTYTFPRSQMVNFGPMNFSIRAGESVAFDLPSGKGRTTLLQLLSGVLHPHSGKLAYTNVGDGPGRLLTDLPNASVAYLSSHSHFFEGTLLQNLTRFNEKDIPKALSFANETGLADFVAFLPKGWDTMVGHAISDTLPKAYRQRISLLSALYKNPRLILLDEPAATLDELGESMLLQHLLRIKGQVTLVVCSDRSHWHALADRHIALSKVLQIEASSELTQSLKDQAVANSPLDESMLQNESITRQSVEDRWALLKQTLDAQFRKPSHYLNVLGVLMKELQVMHSAREIAESAPYYYDAMTESQMFNTLARLGFEASPVNSSADLLSQLSLPLLVLPNHGAPYVLIRKTGIDYVASSNLGEESRYQTKQIDGKFFNIKKLTPVKAKTDQWVSSTVSRFKPHVYAAITAAVWSGILLAVSPLLTMQIYSSVIPSGSLTNLLSLFVGSLLALVLCFLFMRHRIYLIGYLAGRIEFLFGSSIFEKILRMPPTMTEGSSVGAQMARLRSFESIRDFFTTPLASAILELPISLVFLMLLAWINPWCILIFCLAAFCYLALYLTQFKSIASVTRGLMSAATERNRFLNEFLSSMRSIRNLHGEKEWFARFIKLSSNATMLNFEVERKTALSVSTSHFIMIASAVCVVAVSTPMVINQNLSSGALIASMLLIWRILLPLQILYTNITRIERIRSAVQQINSLMRLEREPETRSTTNLESSKLSVQFSKLSYRYAGSTEPALSNFSMSIDSGKMVCFTGSNGSGKSTAIKLMLRMLPMQNGAILLGGLDVRQHNPVSLRRMIGYAPQDIQFFRATLLQNLRLAKPEAAESEIRILLTQLNAWGDISALRDGLHTRLGDNTNLIGSMLLQKLNICRAILTDAPVVVMDDPTQHLDHDGVVALAKVLSGIRHTKTIILITQEANLLSLADEIVWFESGFVRSKGVPIDILPQIKSYSPAAH